MADALASGASVRKGVGVQIPPRPFGHWHLKPARLPFRHSRALTHCGGRPPEIQTGQADTATKEGSTGEQLSGSLALARYDRVANPRRTTVGLFDRVERGLERAVHGVFAKAFKAEVQPVEIAAAMRRAMDDRAAVIGHGRTFVPNLFAIELATTDYERLMGFSDMLTDELVASAQEHAESQRYQPGGPIQVNFVSKDDLETGVFRVRPSTAKGVPPVVPPVKPAGPPAASPAAPAAAPVAPSVPTPLPTEQSSACLLYTSDAADDLLCVDLGGRRIIK